MKKLHIQTSGLTNTIFGGHVLKCGKLWAKDKQDVTLDCLFAVAEHAIRFGKPISLDDGKNKYKITVEKTE